MSLLEFIVAWWTASVDLVRAVAWPAVVVASILLLRQPLSQLIPALQSLKMPGAEATFYEGLRRAERADSMTVGPGPSVVQGEATAVNSGQTVDARAEVNKEAEQPTSKTDIAAIAESIRKTARKSPLEAVKSATSWMN